MHPFLAPHPIAVAHRGGAEEAPENTMAAFEAAVGLGFTYLETDVHTTADGVVVAFHDPRLDRVTDRIGAIDHLGIADVEEADAGYWFTKDGGQTFPFRGWGQTVPRLSELLERFPNARLNIDPKADASVVPLLTLLNEFDAFDRVCIGAFSDRRLAAIRKLSRGRACTSMGPRAVARLRLSSWLGVGSVGEADCVQIPVTSHGIGLVEPELIRACHRHGVQVHVWTVNDPAEMDHLLDLGVDGLMSDRPRELGALFERRGLALDGSARPTNSV